jgi:DNA-binding MarR family transcriptional regulator
MSHVETTFFEQNTEPLEQRIATGLYKVGLALKHQSWRRAAEDGLSPTQGEILAVLSTTGEMRTSQLARRLALSTPTVSISVRALVEKSLVEKAPDDRDARTSLLKLTAEGKRHATKALGWPEFLACAVGEMSKPEQEAFLLGLFKMIRVLQEKGQIPLTRMCVSCRYFRPHAHAGSDQPHHCALVDAPMGPRHLRVDCAEHELAPDEQRAAAWSRFTILK